MPLCVHSPLIPRHDLQENNTQTLWLACDIHILWYDWCELHTLIRQSYWCEISTLMQQSHRCEIHILVRRSDLWEGWARAHIPEQRLVIEPMVGFLATSRTLTFQFPSLFQQLHFNARLLEPSKNSNQFYFSSGELKKPKSIKRCWKCRANEFYPLELSWW